MEKTLNILFRKKVITTSIAILLSAIAVAPVQALTLSFLGTFSTGVDGGGAGIAFDPVSGHVFVSDGSTSTNSIIREFSFDVDNISASTEVNSFTAATRQKGLHVLTNRGPSNNHSHLLMARSGVNTSVLDRLLEVETNGNSADGSNPVDLLIDQINTTTTLEAKGVTIGPNGDFLVADEENSRILQLDNTNAGIADGTIVNQFDMTSLTGSGFISDLEGLAYFKDDILFVVSDSDGGTGKATVYELDISLGLNAATFVAKTFLGDVSFGDLNDPEGLAIDLAKNILFVSDNSGNKVGVYQINAVPIPGALFLLGSALLGLIGVARRKQAIAA